MALRHPVARAHPFLQDGHLPGSHDEGHRRVAGHTGKPPVRRRIRGNRPCAPDGQKGGWGGLHGSDVPAVAVETQPGDLAVFNHSTKHSAWGGGKRRRMFTIVYTGHHTDGPSLEAFRKIIRQHGYTTREVFGREDGPLLSTATPERLQHLQNLITHIPKAA